MAKALRRRGTVVQEDWKRIIDMHAKMVAFLVAAAAIVAASCSKDPAVSRQQFFDSGKLYVEQKKYPEAIIEFRKAIQIDPKFGEARYQLAEAYDRQGDRKNAFSEYVRAADLLPDNFDAQFKAATFLVADGKFEDAKARAQKILAKDPNNIDGLLMLAAASTKLKDFDGAMFYVEEAIKIAPTESRTYATLGGMQFAQGRMPEAEAAFKQAVKVDPNSLGASLMLGRFYSSTGRIADAEAAFGRVLQIDSNSEIAHVELAGLYRSTGQWPKVETHFKWLADNSTELRPKLQLADYYVLMNRPADAVKHLEELSTRKGAYAEVQSRLASIRVHRGRQAGRSLADRRGAQARADPCECVDGEGWLSVE